MLDAVGASKLVAGAPIPRPSPNQARAWRLISRNGAISFTATNRMRWGKPSKVSNGEAQIVGVIDGGSDSMGSLTLYMPRETISGVFGDENPSFPSVTALCRRGHGYG